MPSATFAEGPAGAAIAVGCRVASWLPSDMQPASVAQSSSGATLPIGHHAQALVGGAPERQPHLETSAGLSVAHELDGAAVRLHAFGDDRQADTRSANGAALRPPPLI